MSPAAVQCQGSQLLTPANMASRHPDSNQFTRGRCLTLLPRSQPGRGTSKMSPRWLWHLSADPPGTHGAAQHRQPWDLLPGGHLPPSWPHHSVPTPPFPGDATQRSKTNEPMSKAKSNPHSPAGAPKPVLVLFQLTSWRLL